MFLLRPLNLMRFSQILLHLILIHLLRPLIFLPLFLTLMPPVRIVPLPVYVHWHYSLKLTHFLLILLPLPLMIVLPVRIVPHHSQRTRHWFLILLLHPLMLLHLSLIHLLLFQMLLHYLHTHLPLQPVPWEMCTHSGTSPYSDPQAGNIPPDQILVMLSLHHPQR